MSQKSPEKSATKPAAKPSAKPAAPVTPPAAPAPAVAEKAEEKAAQPRKKRAETPIYKFYKIEKSGAATRLRKECPRCGKGVFLAEHKDRMTCGKCGYTSYKKPAAR